MFSYLDCINVKENVWKIGFWGNGCLKNVADYEKCFHVRKDLVSWKKVSEKRCFWKTWLYIKKVVWELGVPEQFAMGMWKEMVSEIKLVSEKMCIWKKLMSNKIGHLKTVGVWKGIVLEKHFASENMGT